ncbi:hypothetical protein RM780_02355 [Streptomyces sp. DSM 44917]|uniref:Phage protein n=1 Tax=Streptomyces boetiae TaxID=3075541 RepID=A0ABU2L2L6_9ACTN|nr:hypothetical protein [Streptomyces sp. DSM 44917]MDT0305806.1 hypothetical protein [Streptomyces sp. DSM 44917]
MRAPLAWGPGGLPVPYAAAWSAEKRALPVARALTVRPGGAGLAYRDERPGDRDRHGVLWARMAEAPGEGRPDFRALHSVRQREAMLRRLCQVCGGPAERTSRGWLFLMQRPEGEPEGMLTTKPPVCRPCAGLAARHCPRLTDPVAVHCRKPRVWGVFGGFLAPAPGGRFASSEDGHIPYGDPAAPWFLASQLVIELTRCTRAATLA